MKDILHNKHFLAICVARYFGDSFLPFTSSKLDLSSWNIEDKWMNLRSTMLTIVSIYVTGWKSGSCICATFFFIVIIVVNNTMSRPYWPLLFVFAVAEMFAYK